MPYFFENTKNGMVSRVFFSETILMRIENVMLNQKMLNPVVHNAFEYFTNIGQKRDGSVISTLSFVILFENWTDIGIFQERGKGPLSEGFVNNEGYWDCE